MKHTPGPWTVEKSSHEVWAFGEVADGEHANNPVCTLNPRFFGMPANARLIAASPALAEACEAHQRVANIVLGAAAGPSDWRNYQKEVHGARELTRVALALLD